MSLILSISVDLPLGDPLPRPTARCSAPETYEDGSAQEEQGEDGHSSGHCALAVLRGPQASDAMPVPEQ